MEQQILVKSKQIMQYNLNTNYYQNKLGLSTYQLSKASVDANIGHVKILMIKKIDWIAPMAKLYISSNYIDDGAIKLLMSRNWPNLQSLWLNNNKIKSKGVRYIVQAEIPNLTILNLCLNEIGNQGAKSLTKSNWPSLKWLILKGCNLNDDSIYQLATNSLWPNLQTLNLKQNNIGTAHALNIVKYNQTILSDIKLSGNSIKKEMKHIIQDSIPIKLSHNLFKDT